MAKLHFDVRDIFRVIRLGWSGKKIWVSFCGLLIAYAGYSILLLVAHGVSGNPLGQVWRQHGLFPGAALGTLPLPGTIIHVVAMLYALAVVLLATCMVCKITYQQLRGDDFYSSGDAWKFLKGNWSGALLGPVAVLALFVFFLATGIIIGWLAGIIPVVGEILFALSFVPIFFAALVAVFVAIAFVVAFSMTPAIVGTVGEDTLEAVIQSFSLVWTQPWRLVLYCLWMKVSVLIGAVILGSFLTATLWLLASACGLFMGTKLANMMQTAQYYVPGDIGKWGRINVLECLPEAGTPSGPEVWAGRILAVMLIVVAGLFISYVHSAYASGTSLIYVILRKRKDDENLLEWEDETTAEEPPPAPAPEEEKAETQEPASEDKDKDKDKDKEEGEASETKPSEGGEG